MVIVFLKKVLKDPYGIDNANTIIYFQNLENKVIHVKVSNNIK